MPSRPAPPPAAPSRHTRLPAPQPFDPAQASRSARRRAPVSPLTPRPRRVYLDAAALVVGLGFGACVGLAITAESWSQLRSAGGVAMFLGSLTGLAGSYLALVMVLLVSRVPAVERVLGQDGLLRWHRRLAPWPISLIVAHALLITLAYAQAAHTGAWHEAGVLIGTYPYMVITTVALGLMVSIAVASIHAIRTRLRRETWWALHLFMYLALALAFAHEIALGPSFVGHPLTTLVWSVVWAATAGLVLAYRFGLPAVRSWRHQLRVVEVRPEAPGVVSVILKGRNLERLRVSGGQFFEWRFLTPAMWWRAHPFSISARPRPPHVRLTVKAVGEHSAGIARLRPGTRVAIEGPYGAFTAHARRRDKVALIAGGIGVTSVRSLLEDLPRRSQPVVVLRAAHTEELALSEEVSEIVQQMHGRVHELVGARADVPVESLLALVPDLGERDVFVSGSEGFVNWVVGFLARVGIAKDAIHYEIYAV